MYVKFVLNLVQSKHVLLVAAAIEALVVQTVIFILTFMRTGFLYRQARVAGIEAKLAALLLRDGENFLCFFSR